MSHISASAQSSEAEEEEYQVVETDPNETYVRFEHKLGSGAFKTVYRALDTDKGIEVAWNQVLIDRYQLDKEKILKEIKFFQKIRHEHIIDFYHYWTDKTKNQVVFITELMPSGTLTDYIEKSPDIKLKIIKSWSIQILKGLNYLHTRNPPIIHRDIKCANIFINGTTEGEVKIGDLGLATFCKKKDCLSVIGTPEFMAPEYYNENYSTSVDIWAFGMSVIEMVTKQHPYSECDNVGQIFKKVSGGILPKQLDLIADQQVKNFILLCLADEDKRPTAAQLLDHEFFSSGENDNFPVALVCNCKCSSPNVLRSPKILSPVLSSESVKSVVSDVAVEDEKQECQAVVKKIDLNVIGRNGDVLEIKAEISSADKSSTESSEIEFRYNLVQDDVSTTVNDMVKSFGFDSSSYTVIASALSDIVQQYDRAQIFTELSELISDDLDDLVDDDEVKSMSGNSIKSEPQINVRHSNELHINGIFSDSELRNKSPLRDFNNFDNGCTSLEFLVDEDSESMGNISQLSVPSTSGAYDTTELQDLLDDDYSMSESDSEVNTASIDEVSDLSTSEEDDEEIQALKEKHKKDLDELLKIQEEELLQKKQLIRKQTDVKENVRSINEIYGKHRYVRDNLISA